MASIVIDLESVSELELEAVDVGVADDTIAFSVEGTIRGTDAKVLDTIRGKSLTPTAIHFSLDD